MELSRKFRVLNQTLSMHTFLRDRYANRALLIDVLLLASAVIFVVVGIRKRRCALPAGPYSSGSALCHPGFFHTCLHAFSPFAENRLEGKIRKPSRRSSKNVASSCALLDAPRGRWNLVPQYTDGT